MNNIIKEEITIVQNKEGAIFKVGDIVKKAVKGRTDDFVTPSKIISFNVRKNNKDKLIITAITDFKYNSGALHKTGILIDKLELCGNLFPRCFKIRSLGNRTLNLPWINKLNNFTISVDKQFTGHASSNCFYYLNLDDLKETDCDTNPNPKFEEVTIEQFLKYCEDEKI